LTEIDFEKKKINFNFPQTKQNFMKIYPLIFGLFLAVSCQENLSPNALNLQKDEMVIGDLLKNGSRNLSVTDNQLMSLYGKQFNLTSIDRIKSYLNDKNVQVLEFSGPHKDGKHYVTIGKAIEAKKGKLMMTMAGCTQSCTSDKDCSGCTLSVFGDCSGSCSCNTGMGSCTHTVTTSGGGGGIM
jgi:hypothetical protein